MSTLKEDLLEAIKHYKSLTFAELQNRFGDHFKGDTAITHPEYPHLIFWTGMSPEFANALIELYREGKAHWELTSPIVYLLDGIMLKFPILKRAGLASKVKKDHWVPVAVSFGPCAPKPKRLRRKT